MTRLSAETLAALPASVKRPGYDRGQRAGVVHLGIGAFHRAHQAAYFDSLMRLGEAGWMIRAASLRSASVAEQLSPQDGLYMLDVREGEQSEQRVIASVCEVLVAPDDPAALVAALASPDTQLVTLTVTEKGYCLDPSSGALRRSDPGIAADIADPAAPQTAPGFLVAGLAVRRASGLGPFTILSCDNMPDNGARTRRAVIELAAETDPGLADWIASNGAFPSSMVDRIVPATTPADLDALEAAVGLRDEGMVKAEPFTQWVIEDHFCAERPPLDRVGVDFTPDVAPWEKAKLRLLNGSHSALAYLGALAGLEFVDTAIAAPGYAAYVNRIWDEAQDTLDPIKGFDPAAYRAALSRRYANSALSHRTRQIAMDGSQKLPQRLLAPIRERLAAGKSSPALTLAVAAWIRWQMGEDDDGRTHVVDDPLSEETAAIVLGSGRDPRRLAASMLSLSAVFGEDLRREPGFVADLDTALSRLMEQGAARVLAEGL